MSKYLCGPITVESTMLTPLQSSKLRCLQAQLRSLNFHRQRAISRITIPPYIFTEEEKHTIICNYRLWDDTPLQLALALEYAPTSLVDPTPKPRRGITAEIIRQEIDWLRMPVNLYHYTWDLWDPDRWHIAPDGKRDHLAHKLMARYENLFRQGQDNFLGLIPKSGVHVCVTAPLSGRQVLKVEPEIAMRQQILIDLSWLQPTRLAFTKPKRLSSAGRVYTVCNADIIPLQLAPLILSNVAIILYQNLQDVFFARTEANQQEPSNAHEAQNQSACNYLHDIINSADEKKAKETPPTSATGNKVDPAHPNDEASNEESSAEDELKSFKQDEKITQQEKKPRRHGHRSHGSDSKKGGSYSSGGSHSRLVSVANKIDSFVDGKSVIDSGRGFSMRKGN
ncbi:MAG: hypothetical protein Q9192_003940 [Flavoplaca navasiana]